MTCTRLYSLEKFFVKMLMHRLKFSKPKLKIQQVLISVSEYFSQ